MIPHKFLLVDGKAPIGRPLLDLSIIIPKKTGLETEYRPNSLKITMSFQEKETKGPSETVPNDELHDLGREKDGMKARGLDFRF